MSFYLSPLVDVNEIDLTTTIPAVATSIGVIVLRNTYKGPENKKTLITSTNELIDRFGQPRVKMYRSDGVSSNTAFCYQDILSAIGFLKYGNKLYCTRTMPASATFSGTIGVSGTDPSFEPFTGESGAHPSYILTDLASEDPDEFHEDIVVTGNYPFYIIAASRGRWGNNLRIAVIGKADYDDIIDGSNDTWEVYPYIAAIDSPLDTTKEFLLVVQEKEQGESTWTTKEIWNVSTNEDKLDDQGISMFAETKINGDSNYIRIALNEDQKNTAITWSTQDWQQLGGGYDYDSAEDAFPSDAVIINGYELYDNPDEIDVNIFIDSNKSNTVKQELISICETDRKDCMAILDVNRDHVLNNKGNETTDLRDWRRGSTVSDFNENTSYAAVYANWLEVYDKWTQKYRWVPASGYVAGIYANTDDVSDPWFAPAGLNRARLQNIRRLAFNPNQGQRDILYQNGLNPIVSFAGQGKVVYGQKTYLDKSSAFNRVNVRRLFLVLEKAISTASKYFLFEPNDEVTRVQLTNMIDPFLRDVKGRRGIYDFLIICDETNNTPERIDRNELWCDIYIKPTRAAEFIVLNFIATKTGASFTEIASLRTNDLV